MRTIGNWFWQFLGRGLGRGFLWLYFLAIPLLAGAEAYGRFAYAFSISMIAATLFLQSGGDLVVVRQSGRGDDSYLTIYLRMRIFFCAIAGTVLAGAAALHPHLRIYCWLLAYWFFWCLQDLFFAYLRSQERMKAEGLIGLAQNALPLPLMYVLWRGRVGAPEVVPAVALSAAAGLGLTGLILVSPEVRAQARRIFKKTIPRVPWTSAIREIGLLGVITALSALYYHIDKVMLGRMISAREVGFYSLGVRIVEALYGLPALAMAVYYPRLTREPGMAATRSKRIFGGLILAASAVVIFGTGIGSKLIPLIWGPEFAPTGEIFRVLILSAIPVFAGYLITQMLVAEGRLGAFFGIALSSCLLNIGLNLVLIPRAAGIGAAWATLITEAGVTLAGAVVLGFLPFRRPRSGRMGERP